MNKQNFIKNIKQNIFSLSICSLTIILSLIFAIVYKSSILVISSSLLSIITVLFTLHAKVIASIIAIFDAIFYALVSYLNGFYGEVIIHIFIIIPISIYAIIEWFNNRKKSQVKIKKVSKKEVIFISCFSVLFLFGFYFLLRLFNTQQLIPSTLSILFTSLGCFYVARRSGFGFIMYVLSDICLMIMWGSLIISDEHVLIPIFLNQILFLILDTYSVIKWNKIYKNQQQHILNY